MTDNELREKLWDVWGCVDKEILASIQDNPLAVGTLQDIREGIEDCIFALQERNDNA